MSKQLLRPHVRALDTILGRQFRVLDDGFVRVIDYMGSDSDVVRAARVSYGSGTKRTRTDEGLIRYLMRHRHTTPFEMCEIKLHVRVPMDTWRQWIRHRTANVNEYSTRYSVAINAAQRTLPNGWRKQAVGARQGSAGRLPLGTGRVLTQREADLQALAWSIYEERLSLGVAREQARKDLPLSTFTEAYWKIDLHNLLHFLELRLNSAAQIEIREYASAIAEIVSRWCPITWRAFQEYRLSAVSLSARELAVLRCITAGRHAQALALARSFGWVSREPRAPTLGSEAREAEEKLLRIGVKAPWVKSPRKPRASDAGTRRP
jgi:thymidylate synthase (FAD)